VKRMKLIMIGNGMAGVRTLEEILRIAPDLYDITVFGAEPHANYNRILLSPVLAGEMTLSEIMLNDVDWYQKNGITLHLDKKITKIDRIARKVIAADGTEESYDRLLLATGSNPFVLPIPGKDLPGVITYRDIQDTNAMIDAAGKYRRAVVIGGGLLGLEAANGLKLRGMDVTVVHLAEWLMERQLDKTAADMLKKSLEDKGLKFLLKTQTTEILANAGGRVGSIRFSDGEETPADLVVMAVGIKPNDDLAKAAGLYCTRGVVVSDTMQTYDPRIYAVGECASHRGIAYGLVAPLFEMGKVCANHLAHRGIGRYEGSVSSTKLKVTGVELFSVGRFQGDADTEEIVLHDPIGGIYKKLVLKDDCIVGGVMVGDTGDGAWYLQMLCGKKNVADIRDHLMFGQASLENAGRSVQSNTACEPGEVELALADGAENRAAPQFAANDVVQK
jgi:nitrite reductase (NADH) large subunit